MMKITTFNPQIITTNADDILPLFEELGFKIKHQQTGIGELGIKSIVMEDAGGFKIDISEAEDLPKETITAIRMNVDDFEEAYRKLTANGFRNIYGVHSTNTASARSAIMVSKSGITINLIQHIRK